MQYSHISIGGGITGIETIVSVFNNIHKKIKKSKILKKKFKNKKISFAVIDKKPENIPGGVAYGIPASQYGYFNNPIRLSPKEFSSWLVNKETKRKLINYLVSHGGYTGKEWLKKNKKILLSTDISKFKELYIPRAVFNFWMEERLILLMLNMKKISKKFSILFKIDFFKGEVIKIKKLENYNQILFKNNFCEKLACNISKNKFKKFKFKSYKKIKEPILSKTQSIGIGMPPPKQLATLNAQKNSGYIWDFYSKGSTSFLINKILKLKKSNKKIKIYFIGYKAGLLESLPELKKIILKKKIRIEMTCSSKDLESIQKAQPSKNKKKYKFILLKKNYLKNIKTAKKLYLSILKEFNLSVLHGYKKYDAWTLILSKNILNKCINCFNEREKKLYNDNYHNKIRSITRFTYPETIYAKDQLIEMKVLKTKKEIVKKVDVLKKKLIVTAKNNNILKKYICDLVVNVSGPLSVKAINNEIPLIHSLKKNGAKTSISGGFIADKNFKIIEKKNVYVPSVLSRGFNPERKTIIKAILENSGKSGQSIAKTLLGV